MLMVYRIYHRGDNNNYELIGKPFYTFEAAEKAFKAKCLQDPSDFLLIRGSIVDSSYPKGKR